MKTILVDDELWALKQFEMEAADVDGIEIAGIFSDSDEALAYAKEHSVDFALLDVEMPGMNGIELGEHLREIYPDIVIIYVSSHPHYFAQAYQNVRADYYLLKPYSKQDVEDVIKRAKLLLKRQYKRVFFRTFGRFDMFVDDKPIKFSNAKAKELLAICVDRRGGVVTLDEAIGKLWEDSPPTERIKTRYRKAVAYLHALLSEYDAADIFVSGYGTCHIERDKVDCDYYDFLAGRRDRRYSGEYMYEYSWAEMTAAAIEQLT